MRKLGIHIQDIVDVPAMRQFIREARPSIIKTMDRRIEEVLTDLDYDPLVIGRKFFEHQPLTDPRGVARRIADDSLGRLCQRGVIHAMEAYNEINPHNGRCWEYVDWQLELVDELTALGIPYVAGSWSVGCPDEVRDGRIVYWDHTSVHELMRKAAYLGLHEYLSPSMWDARGFDPPHTGLYTYITTGWYMLRYRKVYAQLREHMSSHEVPPFIIIECGIDSGAHGDWDPQATGGYKSFGSIENYLMQLDWYDCHLQMDPYVVGATPFLFSSIDQKNWGTYDLWEHRAEYAAFLMTGPPQEFTDWLITLAAKSQIPFVPGNFIEDLGIRNDWRPLTDELQATHPTEGQVVYKVFMGRGNMGERLKWEKKIVWWRPGQWESYKVVTTSN